MGEIFGDDVMAAALIGESSRAWRSTCGFRAAISLKMVWQKTRVTDNSPAISPDITTT